MLNENFKRYQTSWINARAPHLTEFINKEDAKILFSKGGYLIRSTCDFDCNIQTPFWYLIKDQFSGFEELNSKTRQKIRKALKNFNIYKGTKEELIEKGYDTYVAALKGYRVKSNILSKENFIKKIQNFGNEYDFWFCIQKETMELAAYAINRVVDDVCEYDIMRVSRINVYNSYPGYALFYKMNDYYLETRKLKYVSDGTRSISEHSNIQSFVQDKFNFRKAYCRLQVEYVWWLKIFVHIFYKTRNIIPFTHKIPALMLMKSLFNQEAMRRGEM